MKSKVLPLPANKKPAMVNKRDQQSSRKHRRKEKELRDNLTEHQIDTMIINSFPASDPPSTY